MGTLLLRRRSMLPRVSVPENLIVMWPTDIGTIPEGWSICDGTNGTPDLRNRFVVGAGDTYAVGNTGNGSIPEHSHLEGTLAFNSTGSSHTHSIPRGSSAGTSNMLAAGTTYHNDAGDATGMTSSHSHTISGSTGNYGSGSLVVATYYAFIFIKNTGDAELPDSAVLLWQNAIANIPSGWDLCDGTGETPNAQNRFAIGAGDTYTVGNTGGGSVPEHNHGDGTLTSGSESNTHGHTVSMGSSTGAGSYISERGETYSSGVSTGSAGAHTHSITGSVANYGSGTQVITKHHALAYIYKNAGSLVTGIIGMLESNTPPEGWSICDGTNGTPDLRNRFVVGAGDTYAVDATGDGSIPEHAHTAGTLATNSTGAHTHSVYGYTGDTANGMPLRGTSGTSAGATNSGNADHTHTVSGETGNYGSGIEVIAVYYALNFIMKE